jgi:hypothetical protein
MKFFVVEHMIYFAVHAAPPHQFKSRFTKCHFCEFKGMIIAWYETWLKRWAREETTAHDRCECEPYAISTTLQQQLSYFSTLAGFRLSFKNMQYIFLFITVLFC